MTELTVVLAPDSFKGSAPATEVTAALGRGWAAVRPGDLLVPVPMADGGEGTLDAFELAHPGSTRMPLTVVGPDDRPVRSYWLLLPDGRGVVELASTSGLGLLDRPRPRDAHTTGFGQTAVAALDSGVRGLVLAIGGSSSTDGGAGALRALGAAILDGDGDPVAPGNRGLAAAERVDLSSLRSPPPDGVEVLGDVTNPLLGPAGAASVFGPQKGATPTEVLDLEAGLARFASLVPIDPARPGAGAAGGTGFGLLAWGATLAPGSRAVGEALGLPDAVSRASVVVTGEGAFDSQTADGKVVSYVLSLAAASGVPAMLVAGMIGADTSPFVAVQSLVELAGSTEAAMADAGALLERAGAALARAVRD